MSLQWSALLGQGRLASLRSRFGAGHSSLNSVGRPSWSEQGCPASTLAGVELVAEATTIAATQDAGGEDDDHDDGNYDRYGDPGAPLQAGNTSEVPAGFGLQRLFRLDRTGFSEERRGAWSPGISPRSSELLAPPPSRPLSLPARTSVLHGREIPRKKDSV
jgi:hypothetical protein